MRSHADLDLNDRLERLCDVYWELILKAGHTIDLGLL
jgi:hypothetical protein